MNTLTAVLLYAMVLPATLFPIIYSRLPWIKSNVGRSVMTLALALALLVDVAALSRITGRQVPIWVVAVVYALVAVGLYYQLITLVKVRWEERGRSRTTRNAEEEL